MQDWAHSIQQKLSSHERLLNTKIDYEQKLLRQEQEIAYAKLGERILNFSVRIEELSAQLRSDRDIQSQQTILIDQSTKKAHERLDSVSQELDQLQKEMKGLLDRELVEATVKETRAADPIRSSLTKMGEKLLYIVLGGLLLYIARNLGAIFIQLTQ